MIIFLASFRLTIIARLQLDIDDSLRINLAMYAERNIAINIYNVFIQKLS